MWLALLYSIELSQARTENKVLRHRLAKAENKNPSSNEVDNLILKKTVEGLDKELQRVERERKDYFSSLVAINEMAVNKEIPKKHFRKAVKTFIQDCHPNLPDFLI